MKAVAASPITLLSPKTGTSFIADRLPFALKLAWRAKPNTRPAFLITIAQGGEKPRIFARTDGFEHTLALEEHGDYAIAVQSVDVDTVGPPAVSRVSILPQVATVAAAVPQLDMREALPPSGFALVGAHLPTKVDFAWSDGEILARGDLYEISLSNDMGKVVGVSRVAKPFAQIKIETPGSYHWQVRLIRKDQRAKQLESPKRRLTVFGPGVPDIATTRRGVLYLSRGL